MDGIDSCDLCGSASLTPIYRPEMTQRDLTVFVCSVCGLVQSLPRIDKIAKHILSSSSGADFGNLRYGKQFSLPLLESILRKHLDKDKPKRCLDVGAGRGWVAQKISELVIVEDMWCVEPDTNLVNPNETWKWIQDRIENVVLPETFFDVITLIHTLEHVKSPRLTLCKLNASMIENGLLYVVVPNIEYIGTDGQIAEWFLDKHIFHFSPDVLMRLLKETGFSVVEKVSGGEDINILARKTTCIGQHVFDNTLALIDKYNDNRKRLNDVVQQNVTILNDMVARGDKIGVWGAGRILDAYREAGLNVKEMVVVDLYIPETGLTLSRESKDLLECDLVVIMSNAYREEIRGSLRSLGFKGGVGYWDIQIAH